MGRCYRNPFGLEHTVTVGVISAKNRPFAPGISALTVFANRCGHKPGTAAARLDLDGKVVELIRLSYLTHKE